MNSVEFVFSEDRIILDAVGRQMWNACKAEIRIQVKVLLCNCTCRVTFGTTNPDMSFLIPRLFMR